MEKEVEKERNMIDIWVIKYMKENFYMERRNGKGKEYDSKGNIEFEGEFFNGKKWN